MIANTPGSSSTRSIACRMAVREPSAALQYPRRSAAYPAALAIQREVHFRTESRKRCFLKSDALAFRTACRNLEWCSRNGELSFKRGSLLHESETKRFEFFAGRNGSSPARKALKEFGLRPKARWTLELVSHVTYFPWKERCAKFLVQLIDRTSIEEAKRLVSLRRRLLIQFE
jgi:hypothetical protein